MSLLEAGKVYQDNESKKVVLVFGITERPLYSGSVLTKVIGVGVDLTECKVDEVSDYSTEMTTFSSLDSTQLINFGHYYPIYVAMSKRSIVAISGKARSGKDSLSSKLAGVLGMLRTALGDPIRTVRSTIYGNSDSKNRDELILIGQGLREKDQNIWIKSWLRRAIDQFALDIDAKLTVTDVRQPNEFSFFKSLGALTVRVDANEEKRKEILLREDGATALDDKLLNDETESYVANFDTDLIIFNEYDSTYNAEVQSVIDRLTNDEG